MSNGNDKERATDHISYTCRRANGLKLPVYCALLFGVHV